MKRKLARPDLRAPSATRVKIPQCHKSYPRLRFPPKTAGLPRPRLQRAPRPPPRSPPGPGEGQVWHPPPAASRTPAANSGRAGPVSARQSQIFVLRKTRRKRLSCNRTINQQEEKCVNNKMFLVHKSQRFSFF